MKKIIFLLTCLLAMSTYQSAYAQALRLYKRGNIVQTITAAEFDSIVSIGYLETEEDFVDLGLSVKWASCNLGAKSPEDYGDYYAWGETNPKESYTEENSLTYYKDLSDIGGNPKYDAATANYGKGVRLPTLTEFEELIEHTTMTLTELNGVEGHLLVSQINGNSIFFPSTGYRFETRIKNTSSSYFWTSTEYTIPRAKNISFGGENYYRQTFLRNSGLTIRPVRER